MSVSGRVVVARSGDAPSSPSTCAWMKHSRAFSAALTAACAVSMSPRARGPKNVLLSVDRCSSFSRLS